MAMSRRLLPVTIHSPKGAITERTSRGRLANRLAGSLFQVGLVAAPFVAHSAYPMPCPMKLATGLDCAGCGGTRATDALVRGDVGSALDYNALVLLVPVLLVLYFVLRRLKPTWRIMEADPFWLLIAVLAVWTVARNLPGFEMLQAAS